MTREIEWSNFVRIAKDFEKSNGWRIGMVWSNEVFNASTDFERPLGKELLADFIRYLNECIRAEKKAPRRPHQ